MKKRQFLLQLFLALLVSPPIAAVGAMSDELNLLTIENRTGTDLRYVFIAPGDSKELGANVLGPGNVFRIRQEIDVGIHYPNRCNVFSVVAVANNMDYFSVFPYEICDGRQARLQLSRNYFAGKKRIDQTTVVVIENGTQSRFRNLFLTPGDSKIWGIDHLSRGMDLNPGNSIRLMLSTPASTTDYAVRAVDETDQTYTFVIDIDSSATEVIYEIADDWVDKQDD